METIKEIKKYQGEVNTKRKVKKYDFVQKKWGLEDEIIDAEGYQIITNKQEILLLISAEQNCCEDWGYFMTEDNLNNFINSQLIEIYLTDTVLNTNTVLNNKKWLELDTNDIFFAGRIMFVNIATSKGLLQFVAYNDHNGYYGHDAIIISEQLRHRETL